MSTTTKPQLPENANTAEKAAAPLARLSSEADPFPHYFMGVACGVGSYYAHNTLKNRNLSLISGGIGLAYLYSGYLINKGETHLGYHIAAGASVALLAATGPRAYKTGDAYSVSLASLGGLSTLGNFVKAYQQNTGKPREMRFEPRGGNRNPAA
jgi:uncharacterized membrane protein (UPF0136 family)